MRAPRSFLFASVLATVGATMGATTGATAAPLDALLAVDPVRSSGYGLLEASYDVVNKTLDVFGVRDTKDAQLGLGDYSGAHLRLGGWVTQRVWLEGAAWRRAITYGPDKPSINTYQGAFQYALVDPVEVQAGRAGAAVRLSWWTDRSGLLRKSTPTRLNPIGSLTVTVDEVAVSNARDEQFQADLIGSWKLAPSVSANAFVGAGRSRVRIGGVSVTDSGTTISNTGGCSNTVALDGQEISGLLKVDGEACYKATYAQLGGNLQWNLNDRWSLLGGYTLQKLRRNTVDEVIASRGGTAHTVAHTLVGQVNYRVARSAQVFVRGQLMSGPFLGEVPFVYNSLTAGRFDKAYGFASFGLLVDL